jgi:hypothetical protein
MMRSLSVSSFRRLKSGLGYAVFVAAALFGFAAAAHDIITTKLTYTREISRILERRCLSCHTEGSSIPLTTYDEVRPWAVSIKEQVLSRVMPPWGAVKGFGPISPDLALSQEEIQIIAGWVVGGAPKGDTALLAKKKFEPDSLAPLMQDLHRALEVSTTVKLRNSLMLAAITPEPDHPVKGSRITATLPDGQEQPLLWLYNYDPKWRRTFYLQAPLALPAGTVVRADSPLVFALETASQRAPTGTVKTTVFTTPAR